MIELLRQDAEVRRVALRTPTGFFALGFGAGLSRYAPGTAGTLVAVPVAVLLKQLPMPLFWLVLVILFAAGIALCGAAARMLQQEDPGSIVWDEIVGYCLCVALLPLAWPWWLGAFVAFRFFDIIKPWPIRVLERRVGGGLGIMLDDIVAAFYAMLLLGGLQALI